MKKVKNQYKLWDKTNKTFIAVSHGKSSWATLTGVEGKLKDLCTQHTTSYQYNAYTMHKPRRVEEFEIHVYELVCQEVRTYTFENEKKQTKKLILNPAVETENAPLKISWETETWTEQEIHDFKTGK